MVSPRTVVDVGCGTGSWLAEFQRHAVDDVLGLDGPWVDTALLHIPSDRFRVIDLTKPILEPRRFDLVVCLEVAEHLHSEFAPTIVESLTSLGDVILFSAAIPFQGGYNHFNEQWPDYWATLFEARGYQVVDGIRHKIWMNSRVEWWYAQNMFFVVDRAKLSEYPALARAAAESAGRPLAVVHPRAYVENAARAKGPGELFQATLGAVRRRLMAGRKTGG